MIGIFDSGSGGLSVLRALRDRLDSADVLYFGDIKHAPYGTRSREELSALTVAAIKLLKERGVTNIVSACNSVSASLALSLFDTFDIGPSQLIEMVGPTVSSFRDSDVSILLVATPATIASGIYQNAFTMIGKEIVCLPIKDLAGAIEFGAEEAEIERIVREAFATVTEPYDVVILGCTHYPLAINTIRRVVGDIPIFDPAVPVALRAEKQFWPQEVGDGTTTFLISQDSEHFRRLVSELFPEGSHSIEVVA